MIASVLQCFGDRCRQIILGFYLDTLGVVVKQAVDEKFKSRVSVACSHSLIETRNGRV